MTFEVFGWLGAFFFAICALPQVILCVREGHSNGLSWLFLIFWLLGEIFMTVYVWPTGDLPLLSNYIVNLILTSIIFYYKVYPRMETF